MKNEISTFEIAFLTECSANAVARNDTSVLFCVSPENVIYIMSASIGIV